jgi:ribosome biogenesis protein Nip4
VHANYTMTIQKLLDTILNRMVALRTGWIYVITEKRELIVFTDVWDLYEIITYNKPAQTSDLLKDLFEIKENLEIIIWSSTILNQLRTNDVFWIEIIIK